MCLKFSIAVSQIKRDSIISFSEYHVYVDIIQLEINLLKTYGQI